MAKRHGRKNSPFFEIALVLVRADYVASLMVNANDCQTMNPKMELLFSVR
jgi:hypothetical protein